LFIGSGWEVEVAGKWLFERRDAVKVFIGVAGGVAG
jgi:hypothetical protein